jgi:diaminopimelate epimerase
MEKIFVKKIDNNHNNYIYIFEENFKSDEYYSELSKKISSPIIGLGSDGLIVFSKLSNKKFKMLIFNSDGSKAKMCGNGLKGGVVFLCSMGLISLKEENVFFYVHTDSGVKKIIKDNNEFIVNIGEPKIIKNVQNIDINFHKYSLKLFGVDIGNKHFIYFAKGNNLLNIDDFFSFPLEDLFVFTHENYFYEDWKKGVEVVNVSIVSIIKGEVYIRTYERGAKETYACGTASASTSYLFFNFYESILKEFFELNISNLINKSDYPFLLLNFKGGKIKNYNINSKIYQNVNSFILFEGFYYV